MEQSKPVYIIKTKKNGKITYGYKIGLHRFYRRYVIKSGYSVFSCINKQCLAQLKTKYISFLHSMNFPDLKPTILRLL